MSSAVWIILTLGGSIHFYPEKINDHKYGRVVNRMVDAYQNREWSTCSNQIEIIKDLNWNDTLSELYAERIKNPMPVGDWDGVERKTSK